MERPFTGADLASAYGEAPARFRLAATVAAYAEVLRDSYWSQHLDLDVVAAEARRVADALGDDEDVVEFAELAARAAQLEG
jgi:hypothetical protein